MSEDIELIEERMNRIADRMDAVDLVDALNLTVWDVIEAFRDKILETNLSEYLS